MKFPRLPEWRLLALGAVVVGLGIGFLALLPAVVVAIVVFSASLVALSMGLLGGREDRLHDRMVRYCRARRLPLLAVRADRDRGTVVACLAAGLCAALFGLLSYSALPRFHLSFARVDDQREPSTRAGPEPESRGGGGAPWAYPRSGFSSRMRLASSRRIEESDRLAFSVRIVRDGFSIRLPDHLLYWRGTALVERSDGVWVEPEGRSTWRKGSPEEWIDLPGALFPQADDLILEQEFIVEPTVETHLFALPEPIRLRGAVFDLGRVRLLDPVRSLSLARRPRGEAVGLRYEIVSRLHRPSQEELRSSVIDREAAPIGDRAIDPRLAELAALIVDGKRNEVDRVVGIAAWLRSRCRYSIDYRYDPTREPVTAFLLESREGYCEIFAAAMVVLLRGLEIPARVAVGFRGGRWEEFRREFRVRESDAHAWVEVPIEGHGWVGFDPTPGGQDLESGGGAPVEVDPLLGSLSVVEVPEEPEAEGSEPEESDRSSFSWLRGGIALLFLSGGILAWRRFGPDRRTAIRAHAFEEETSVLRRGIPVLRCYDRALAILARRGRAKRPGETPREFADRLEPVLPLDAWEPFRSLSETFEAFRYGHLEPEEIDGVRSMARRFEFVLPRRLEIGRSQRSSKR